jgi:hypothetical protein
VCSYDATLNASKTPLTKVVPKAATAGMGGGKPGPSTDSAPLVCFYDATPNASEAPSTEVVPTAATAEMGGGKPGPSTGMWQCGMKPGRCTDCAPLVCFNDSTRNSSETPSMKVVPLFLDQVSPVTNAPEMGAPETETTIEVQTTEWIFKPRDGRAVVVFSTPRFGAPVTGHTLEPGERFKVAEIQEQRDAGGVRFLKLADGRDGWVVDREPGHEMCYKLSDGLDELWMYEPAHRKPIGLRGEPDIRGARTGGVLNPGEKFRVSEIQAGEHGVLFLRLSDGRGWVFDEKFSAPIGEPGAPQGYSTLLVPQRGARGQIVWTETRDGVLCKKVLDETWICEPASRKPVTILKNPDINGEKTSYRMHRQETFKVVEIEAGEGENAGVLFLRLTDGRGWLFDVHPENGEMCRRVPDITTRTTLPTEAANKIRVQSVRGFGIGSMVEIVSANGTERGTIRHIQEFKHEIVLTRALVYRHPAGSSVALQRAKPARWF